MGYTFTENEMEFKSNRYLTTPILLVVSSIWFNIQKIPSILHKLKTMYFNRLYLEFFAGNRLTNLFRKYLPNQLEIEF